MSVRMRILAVAGACALALAVALAFILLESERALHKRIHLAAPVLFDIAPGSNLWRVALALEAEGFLTHHLFLVIRGRLDGSAGAIKAGTYEIRSGDTPASLLADFARGRTKVFQVTFIEGSRFSDMRQVLAAQPRLRQLTAGKTDEQVMDALGQPGAAPEGRFFPSTYHYEAGTSDLALLARALRRMDEVLAQEWRQRQPDLPYTSPYEALIMASIVEKETARADERSAIAGVFVRRLLRGMKLQTDPTVIYGLGKDFDGDLRSADLVRDTPYNTYTRAGLPPTPIAMPGAASIAAALRPAAGEALYFVAKGDGSHHFSASLREHDLAVRQYQLGRNAR
jgi:UPF0755 protein